MTTSPLPVDGKQCVDLNTFMNSFGDWTLRTEVQVTYSSFYALIFLVGLIGNGISVLISSYCLCFIALDRFRSIVTPLKMPWGIGYAQALMILCWVCCIAIASPLFMAQRLQLIEFNNMTFCGLFCGEYNWPEGHMQLKLAYGISLLVIQFLVPTAIMTYCYWKILQKVRQDWLVPANSSSTMTVEQQAATVLRKRRVMYVLILMVLIFMGSWMPLTIVNLVRFNYCQGN
uniref:G_PROTEIN_RECEP_F1_2 domain-containing protein n=1 Tax=Globodera pallida TaxID=36090 RepID=A0A183CKR7_GLOPA